MYVVHFLFNPPVVPPLAFDVGEERVWEWATGSGAFGRWDEEHASSPDLGSEAGLRRRSL